MMRNKMKFKKSKKKFIYIIKYKNCFKMDGIKARIIEIKNFNNSQMNLINIL